MTQRGKRLGDVLALARRRVAVDVLGVYREIGVRSFGKGIFHKDPISGWGLGNKRVFEIHPGDLVLNNVFAWEGAVAVAGDTERGMIGSHRFLTYKVSPGHADASYLRYFLLSESGLGLLGAASPGSAGRNRTLGISAFENIVVALPSIADQRRVASKLEFLLQLGHAVQQRKERAVKIAPALIDSIVQDIIYQEQREGWNLLKIGEIAEINPRPDRLDSDELVTFVPMSAVEDVSGAIRWPEHRYAGEVSSGYKQFKVGDVIFARITPCMQNGKAAVVENIETVYGYGSTEFHVIRPFENVLPRWIHTIVRTLRFRAAAGRRFAGTAGQQRVPADFLREAVIPVPRTMAEQLRVLGRIDAVLERGRRLVHHSREQATRLDALAPSILNHAFHGKL